MVSADMYQYGQLVIGKSFLFEAKCVPQYRVVVKGPMSQRVRVSLGIIGLPKSNKDMPTPSPYTRTHCTELGALAFSCAPLCGVSKTELYMGMMLAFPGLALQAPIFQAHLYSLGMGVCTTLFV